MRQEIDAEASLDRLQECLVSFLAIFTILLTSFNTSQCLVTCIRGTISEWFWMRYRYFTFFEIQAVIYLLTHLLVVLNF